MLDSLAAELRCIPVSNHAAKIFRSDIIFVGIIVMGITGIFLDGILRLIARYMLRWKYG